MESMLKKDFDFFLNNQNELVKKYNNQYLVIVNQVVVGAYNSFEEALKESIKDHKIGTFLIQKCTSGVSAYTQTFHSRVSFI